MSKAARVGYHAHIFLDHWPHEFLEFHFRSPAQPLMGLAGVAQERLDLGGAEVAGVDLDQHSTALLLDADLVDSSSLPGNLQVDMRKRVLDKFAHRMRFARSKDKIVRLGLLKHQPHSSCIFLAGPPIAIRV